MMASYLMLFSFTQKGMEKVKESPARVEAAKRVIREMGGEVKDFYALLGSRYDTMFILEAPSEEKVAEMSLRIAALGYVRPQTHRILNEEEFKSVATKLT